MSGKHIDPGEHGVGFEDLTARLVDEERPFVEERAGMPELDGEFIRIETEKRALRKTLKVKKWRH